MIKFLMVFLMAVFFIYISICIYKLIKYRRTEKVFLRFMTSCMILFTFTIVSYGDVFLEENGAGKRYDTIFSKDESKVFLSRIDSSIEGDWAEPDSANSQETEYKLSAYFDNTSPGRGATTNLIVTGPPGGKVTAICQYKGHGTPYIMDIGKDGLAVIPVKVENDAEPGVMVIVDITVNLQGKLYKLNAVFTPQ